MYGELEKTLARRTYDESGDYTITPFNLDLKIHRGISGTTEASGVDGTTVHGNNTLFTTELDVGDEIGLFDQSGILDDSGNTGELLVGEGLWTCIQARIAAVEKLT